MVEVFRTNVIFQHQAKFLEDQIRQQFADYSSNFDLEDCDKILRVECKTGTIAPEPIQRLFKDSGFYAEVLPDGANSGHGAIIQKKK
ncbi:MAG: hypothetical protein WD077_16065 [Bacteroidia bacterium]